MFKSLLLISALALSASAQSFPGIGSIPTIPSECESKCKDLASLGSKCTSFDGACLEDMCAASDKVKTCADCAKMTDLYTQFTSACKTLGHSTGGGGGGAGADSAAASGSSGASPTPSTDEDDASSVTEDASSVTDDASSATDVGVGTVKASPTAPGNLSGGDSANDPDSAAAAPSASGGASKADSEASGSKPSAASGGSPSAGASAAAGNNNSAAGALKVSVGAVAVGAVLAAAF